MIQIKRALFVFIVGTLALVVQAGTNKDSVRSGVEARCDVVLYGKEIGTADYVQAIIALGLDISGGGGTATLAFLQSEVKDQLASIGWDACTKVLFDGAKVSMLLNGDVGDVDGGVLTYNHDGYSCNCCFWKCNNPWPVGWIDCSGCSCQNCGSTSFPLPNSFQPYFCWRAKDRSKYDRLRSLSKTLSDLHSGCNDVSKSRNPDCVAAIHRYCASIGYCSGYSQEVGGNVFGSVCFSAPWQGDVSIDTLRNYHSMCDLGNTQSPDCMAAIHRYCSATHGLGAGIAQEVGNGVAGVHCFDPDFYQDITISELRGLHGGCDDVGKSQQPDCVSAIHRACLNRGFAAGIAQEVGADRLGVACHKAPWYRDIQVTH